MTMNKALIVVAWAIIIASCVTVNMNNGTDNNADEKVEQVEDSNQLTVRP